MKNLKLSKNQIMLLKDLLNSNKRQLQKDLQNDKLSDNLKDDFQFDLDLSLDLLKQLNN